MIFTLTIVAALVFTCGAWRLGRRWLNERIKLRAIQHEAEQIKQRQEPGFRWS
jgi:hypothetical protein